MFVSAMNCMPLVYPFPHWVLKPRLQHDPFQHDQVHLELQHDPFWCSCWFRKYRCNFESQTYASDAEVETMQPNASGRGAVECLRLRPVRKQ